MFKSGVIFLEFFFICLVLPTLIIINVWGPYMFFFLWAITGYCFFIVRLGYFDSYKSLFKAEAVTISNLKPIIFRWLIASIFIVLFVYWYDEQRLFYLPRHAPQIIPMIFIAYPLISALPQEFIFCSYFFERFKGFFGQEKLMIFMSALVFAYAHMLYINPIAPIFSFFGGLIFAYTYYQTKSLLLVTIEHSLYGISLFLSGLGWYFYSGAVGAH